MLDPLRGFKAEFFKALAHPTRIKILELLRSGEMSVTELQAQLEIESSSVSQQLAILRGKNIVEARKVGTSVYYVVRDPAIFELLDVARKIFNNHLISIRSMLEQLEDAEPENVSRRKAKRVILASARQPNTPKPA
jgi:DNA-binding transcriptional ArsR family regulator